MDELIKQIRIGLDNNLYLLGLYSILTLPDICGAVNTKKGLANGQNFRAWYEEYVYPNYDKLTSEECYNFRCKLLHQGQTNSKSKTAYYSHIAFAEPRPQGQGSFSINIGQTTINGQAGPKSIDILEFINTVLKSVEEWMLVKKDEEIFKKNINKCIQRHPEGIPGTMRGIPYIY